ncbi:MAG: threonylcarbamoyl-AMP synthase [Clostridia bacterium]|nr:threonylcarbamoyl-AMP synthase [Clostridia bacterium]
MQTNVKKIDADSLAEATAILRSGGVVGLPTETVYGLGGNAFDDTAVQKIFAVKGRPADNPLIAHVHVGYDLSKIIDYDTPIAQKLRKAFLPGPLTLVYPSTGKVSKFVSCGLNTLAVRVPSHEGAQALLSAVDIPIVAPSANLSKHVSPTSAKHVYDDFNGKIPLILDGGESQGGIESTVCDVTGEVPVILRPGLITKEQIAEVCGDCLSYEHKAGEQVKSPGVLYKHYSPRCETALFTSVDGAKEYLDSQPQGKRIGVLADSKKIDAFEDVIRYDLGATPEEMAARLYALLRRAEEECDLLIAVEPTEKGGVMDGVLNRLRKACTSKDILH